MKKFRDIGAFTELLEKDPEISWKEIKSLELLPHIWCVWSEERIFQSMVREAWELIAKRLSSEFRSVSPADERLNAERLILAFRHLGMPEESLLYNPSGYFYVNLGYGVVLYAYKVEQGISVKLGFRDSALMTNISADDLARLVLWFTSLFPTYHEAAREIWTGYQKEAFIKSILAASGKASNGSNNK